MRYWSKYLLIILALFIPVMIMAQGYHTNSNRALKSYSDGLSAYEFLDFRTAEVEFVKAASIDNRFFEAYIMLGELFSKQRRYSEAAANYRIAVFIDSLYYKPIFFALANAEMMSGDYKRALIHFKVYLEQDGMSANNRILAEKNILNCEFALDAIKKPVLFNPQSVGAGINTSDDEYWPSITADGQTIIFTRQPVSIGNSSSAEKSNEDFYLSYYSDSKWQTAINAGAPLNTRQNEGAQSLSSNGHYMFFTACDRSGGAGRCDIYFSSFNNGRWSEPSNLRSPVNTAAWESQPSISADGRTLFFSSNRPGGIGGKDIWYSVLGDDGKWQNPINPGISVNTTGDEMSPFIHFDGKTLYYSSDGRPGMGGFDIYLTRMNADSVWSDPQNLGYPINSYNDELGMIIDASGTKAYFSSVREKSNGKDIFVFDLTESLRPEPVSYLKGKVFDKETGRILKADYELINLSTGKITVKDYTDLTGNFLVCLPSGYNYGLNVSSQGYLFYSENFMFEGQHPVSEPLIKRINLNPVKIGERMVLSNVFYEIDSWELKKESRAELNNLAKLLNDNSGYVIEISGYTDSTGSDEYNKSLSEKRAHSVVNYLISMGISSNRLRSKGYGNSSPLGNNLTPEGRKLNRRTEARIVAEIK